MITNDVLDLMHKYKKSTGKSPTKLFLNKEYEQHLVIELKDILHGMTTIEDNTLFGLTIEFTDKIEYMAVA